MTMTFDHTRLCARCARARKHHKALLGADYTAACIEIDSLAHPHTTWQDGVRMIPALKCRQAILSGILLSREQIREFLARHGCISEPPPR